MKATDISVATRTLVVDTLKGDVAQNKRWLKAADALRSEGVTAAVMEKDDDFRKSFQSDVILLSFTKVEQDIFKKATETLSEEQRVTKRWIRQQMGSRYGTVQRHVVRAEKDEQLTDDERGAKERSTKEQRIRTSIERVIKSVEEGKDFTFDAVGLVKSLKISLTIAATPYPQQKAK